MVSYQCPLVQPCCGGHRQVLMSFASGAGAPRWRPGAGRPAAQGTPAGQVKVRRPDTVVAELDGWPSPRRRHRRRAEAWNSYRRTGDLGCGASEHRTRTTRSGLSPCRILDDPGRRRQLDPPAPAPGAGRRAATSRGAGGRKVTILAGNAGAERPRILRHPPDSARIRGPFQHRTPGQPGWKVDDIAPAPAGRAVQQEANAGRPAVVYPQPVAGAIAPRRPPAEARDVDPEAERSKHLTSLELLGSDPTLEGAHERLRRLRQAVLPRRRRRRAPVVRAVPARAMNSAAARAWPRSRRPSRHVRVRPGTSNHLRKATGGPRSPFFARGTSACRLAARHGPRRAAPYSDRRTRMAGASRRPAEGLTARRRCRRSPHRCRVSSLTCPHRRWCTGLEFSCICCWSRRPGRPGAGVKLAPIAQDRRGH